MDEFGVLVESIGFKAQGKSSAPLAHLKATTKTNDNGFPQSKSNTSFYVDDLDGIFRSNSNPPNSSGLDDVFGGLSVSNSSNSYNYNSNDDVFGLMNTRSSAADGVSPIDDLLAGMGVQAKHQPISSNLIHNSPDLLSNFAKGRKTEASPGAKSFWASAQDPFVMFETAQGSSSYNGASVVVDDYLDSLFPRTNSHSPPTTQDSVYDALFSNDNVVAPKQQKKESSKQPKPNSSDGDFSYLFGMGVSPPSSGQFQEIDGESEERRKARFNHHITTRERMNNALREKNKRDQQAQREQDEKHRVATTLDGDIKRWAVGKEGNLRALLSSLQHVLWDGSGWQPISLTDLITSTAVKKAYYKATLCVHPDKVQQKGASVEHKYIAEKVFDVLKEAWNKFNAEEFKKQ